MNTTDASLGLDATARDLLRPNDQANRRAALTMAEGEDAYRPVRLSAGLGRRVLRMTTVPSAIVFQASDD